MTKPNNTLCVQTTCQLREKDSVNCQHNTNVYILKKPKTYACPIYAERNLKELFDGIGSIFSISSLLLILIS